MDVCYYDYFEGCGRVVDDAGGGCGESVELLQGVLLVDRTMKVVRI